MYCYRNAPLLLGGGTEVTLLLVGLLHQQHCNTKNYCYNDTRP